MRVQIQMPSILFCVCLMLVGSGTAHSDRGERLVIAKAVCVQGPHVVLGDLATAFGTESTVFLEHFASLKVADAPVRQGGKMILTADRIEAALARAAALPGNLEMPSQVHIQQGGRVIPGSAIRAQVTAFLQQAFAVTDAEVRIREYRLPDYLFVPDPKGHLAMESSRTMQPGRVSFRINVVDAGGQVIRRIAVSAFVDVWVTVPCAARPLRRGTVIEPQAVRFERKNLAYVRGSVWNGRGGPWRVKRPMGIGEVMYAKHIELLPTVSKGSRVSLVFDGPTIRLEVPAQALEEGGLGSSILVRNLQSNKQVLALIQDKDTVVVH
ncbi:MAG: flagella basal body P-ring formation protein FlgA [Deltaproteobacteria bacterium]|nr:MAG: flagella basal body P-ring formation protein FlgA [Deltaproteobacteria bacterium]